MTVKIIIGRKVKKGKVPDFLKWLEESRRKTIGARGYVAGETLQVSDDSHNLIVVSTWHSIDEGKNWERNPERKEIQARIEKLTARPTKRISIRPERGTTQENWRE